MKKIGLVILLLCIATMIFSQTAIAPVGSGTSENPYQIASLQNLYWIADQTVNNLVSFSGVYFNQTNDIDAASTTTWFINEYNEYMGWFPIGTETAPFSGIYDGHGHQITNMYAKQDTIGAVGLFGFTLGATISNVQMKNADIHGGGRVGGLVGQNNSTTITNCCVTGTISSSSTYLGGFIAYNVNSTVSRCYTAGSVSGSVIVGGFIGMNIGSNVSNCYTTASVSANDHSSAGFACGNDSVGVISNCYSAGSVWGHDDASGFVGSTSGIVTNCFWDTETSGLSISEGGTGKTTLEMKTPSTFTDAGWDFEGETVNGTNDYWKIYGINNDGYPYFAAQSYPLSVITNLVEGIGVNSAICGGSVVLEEGQTALGRGVCWSTNANPTVANSHTSDGSGAGTYISNVTGLSGDTRYYLRAYASNAERSYYGEEREFITPARLSNMLDFDGIDDNTNTTITMPNIGTIEFWFKGDDVSSGYIWSASQPAINSNWYCQFSNGTLYAWIGSSGNALTVSGLSTNKWYHCAITWAKAYLVVTPQLYLNGNLIGSTGNTWSAPSTTLTIGQKPGYAYFDGQIEEFRIWNTLRTETQIRDNMHKFSTVPTTNLMLYYSFDTSSGNSVPDLAGSGRNATMYNMSNADWITTTVPMGTSGVPVRSVSPASIGNTGCQLTTTITSTPGTNDYLGIYTFGDGSNNINTEAMPFNISQRADVIWGVREFGNVTANLVFNYANLAVPMGKVARLIKRADAVSPWVNVSGYAVFNAANKTFTMSGVTDFSEFSIAFGVGIDEVPGSCLDFEGNFGHVYIPFKASLNTGNVLTIEAWVKPDDITRQGTIYSTRENNVEGAFQLEMGPCDGGTNRIGISGLTGWVVLTGDNVFTLNEWNHIVYTRSGTGMGTHKIYVNGVEKAQLFEADYNYIDNDNARLIGGGTSSMEVFQGRIDEVRIWNTVRTDDEIRQYAYLPLNGCELGLISNWQFNESSGDSLIDKVSGNNGEFFNLYPSDRLISSVPFGKGYNEIHTEANGIVDFTSTGLSMNFSTQSAAEISVSKIELCPNLFPDSVNVVFDAQYWVVDRYGTGSFNADLTFAVSEDLSTNNEANPGNIKLYTRSSNSDTDWTLLASAVSVNAATNTATFNGITGFSQFILAYTAPIALTAPLNVSINDAGANIQISWDAVSGVNSYKVFASDLPDSGFVEVTSNGTFSTRSNFLLKHGQISSQTDSSQQNESSRSRVSWTCAVSAAPAKFYNIKSSLD